MQGPRPLDALARARPADLARRRASSLARFVREELHPFSPFQRARLEAAGFGPRFPADLGALARIPPIDRAALEEEFARADDLSTLAVLPSPGALRARGGFARKLALVLGGRRARALLAASYRPALVTWDAPPGRPPLPVPWTPIDLDLAAEQVALALEAHDLALPGRRALLAPTTDADPAAWLLRLAALSGGAELLPLPATPDEASAASSVHRPLAVRAPDLVLGTADLAARLAAAAAAGLRLPSLRAAVVVTDDLAPPPRDALAAALASLGAPDARAVHLVLLHLPRLVLFACPADPDAGWHVSPERFALEVVDASGRPLPPGAPGTLVATALAGHGVPPLRLALALRARLGAPPCPACRLPLAALVPERAP